MIHEEKKVAKIVEELTMYFFSMGATRIESRITREDGWAVIALQADYDPALHEQLQELEEYLGEPKNDGIADIYWELAGSGDPGESNQLLLLGMLLDNAEVELDGSTARLKLTMRLS